MHERGNSMSIKKILIVFMLIVVIFANTQVLFAAAEIIGGGSEGSGSPGGSSESRDNNNWWEHASGFLDGYIGDGTQIGNSTVGQIISFLDPLVDLVKLIGNMVFVAVTVILGVKYIWGGVDSKASVKDSLTTLIVAALVFYGWNTISAVFMSGGKLIFIKDTAEITAYTIYSTIIYIANFLAVGGLVYIGIRYMMAGAEGKAQLKAKGVPIVLGIIMVYATITFLNFIVGII